MVNVKLSNGVEVPAIGFGTFRNKEAEECINAVETAIAAGYRHIDTAKAYRNEEFVGKAIKNSGIARSEMFVTSKLIDGDQGYDSTIAAYEESCKNLGLDYLDLYLIHWPTEKSGESWKAMEYLYKEKRVRAIGISNFYQHHMDELIPNPEIVPHVNQLECHPFFVQKAYRKSLEDKGIKFEAYAPLAQGGVAFVPRDASIFDNKVLQGIAEAHKVTVAQVVLRWDIQNGIIALPKSANPERIKQNIDVFGFELSASEMDSINALDENRRVSWYPDNFTL